jgi:hypothetical protein
MAILESRFMKSRRENIFSTLVMVWKNALKKFSSRIISNASPYCMPESSSNFESMDLRLLKFFLSMKDRLFGDNPQYI